MRFVRVSTIKDTESVERGRIYSDGSRISFDPPDDSMVRFVAGSQIAVMLDGKVKRVSSYSPDLFLDNLHRQYRGPQCRVSLPETPSDFDSIVRAVDNRSFFAECERDGHGWCLPRGGSGYEGVSEKEWRAATVQARAKAKKAHKPTAAEVARANERMDKLGANEYEKRIRQNVYDRARSRQRLVDEFGDGKTCPCVHCGAKLTPDTVSRDKIYTAREGGRYRHDNLIPACVDCNKTRGDVPFREIEWR